MHYARTLSSKNTCSEVDSLTAADCDTIYSHYNFARREEVCQKSIIRGAGDREKTKRTALSGSS
jgi:hypothetical protein